MNKEDEVMLRSIVLTVRETIDRPQTDSLDIWNMLGCYTPESLGLSEDQVAWIAERHGSQFPNLLTRKRERGAP